MENKKYKVNMVGAPIGQIQSGQVWGGSVATMYAISEAMKGSTKYDVEIRNRNSFKSTEELYVFLKSANIGWADETTLTQLLYMANFDAPDIIGPVCRSPIKNYNSGEWDSIYTPDWFYKAKILRLNENEEKEVSKKREFKGKDFLSKVDFIRHAIDLEKFHPTEGTERKYILWAGQMNRPAKNYQLFKDIVKNIEYRGGLPEGYEFKVMSGYAIEEYMEALKTAAIVVNTSRYESFCNALGEAMACGVACLLPNKLNGDYMYLDRPTQVEYEAKAYADKIFEILKLNQVEEKGKEARKWVEDNCSFDIMRQDIEKVFDKVIEEKNDRT